MTEAGKRLRRLVVTNKVEDSVHLRLLVDEVEAEAVAAERARIRAAVEGLVPVMVRKDMLVPDPKWDDMVTRAAVLDIIEGSREEK